MDRFIRVIGGKIKDKHVETLEHFLMGPPSYIAAAGQTTFQHSTLNLNIPTEIFTPVGTPKDTNKVRVKWCTTIKTFSMGCGGLINKEQVR